MVLVGLSLALCWCHLFGVRDQGMIESGFLSRLPKHLEGILFDVQSARAGMLCVKCEA